MTNTDERLGECDMEESQYTISLEITITAANLDEADDIAHDILDHAITQHGAAAAVLGIEEAVEEEQDEGV